MGTYNFYDEFTLEIKGQEEVIEKLRDTYQAFESDEGRPTDLVCEVTTQEPSPDVVLGGDTDYYGRVDDAFIISRPWGEQMIISRDWDRVAISPETVHHHAAYIIEFELRQRLASNGRALIHASGVQLDGQTFAFPAWRHAGKTNTMLSLLRAGGDYLSDDRLWVEADGSATGYPLPVNVIPSKQQSFDNGQRTTGLERTRRAVSDFMLERIDIERSLIDKAAYFLTKYYLNVEAETTLVPVNALVPGSSYVSNPTRLDAMIFLRTGIEPIDDGIQIEEINRQEALTALVNVNFYEWNERLMEYFRAYDILFPESNQTAQLDSLIDEETRIISKLLTQTPTYRASIPRSRDWIETGIETAVVECIDQFSPTPTLDQLD